MRARELGIAIGELEPGALDAITDVAGVRVGHTTLREGDAIRTGVTVVVPPELPCFAGAHRVNGNGELTGLEWVRESGLLTSQIGLTNTYSVGVVRDAIVEVRVREGSDLWHLPVVEETYDGFLNDIEGMHVRAEHLFAALESAAGGAGGQGLRRVGHRNELLRVQGRPPRLCRAPPRSGVARRGHAALPSAVSGPAETGGSHPSVSDTGRCPEPTSCANEARPLSGLEPKRLSTWSVTSHRGARSRPTVAR
jgi:hypothetical protein